MNDLNNLEDFELANNLHGNNIAELYQKYTAFKIELKKIPLKTLQKNNWVSDFDDTHALSELFTNTLTADNQLFRKHGSAKQSLTALWLAKVTTTAKQLECLKNYHFEGISRQHLKTIAKLSQQIESVEQMPSILAEHGIILIYEKSLPGLKMDGVVFLLPSGIPVIALSFRYARLDSFWFTLLHELAHISLHLEILKTPIFDDLNDSVQAATDIEIQANRLAKNSFVNRSQWRSQIAKISSSPGELSKFSTSIGIHPAIIAGLMRKELNDYTLYSNLIKQVNARDLIFYDN